MVTARLAIGSVSTLALGALLLGAAPYWLNRKAGVTRTSPWGVVSALGVGQSVAAQSDDERQQLLKFAALKTGSAPEPAAAAAPPAQTAAQVDPAPQPAAQIDVAPAQPAAPDASTAPQPSAPVEVPQQMASLEAPVVADAAQDDGAPKSNRVNINTASPSALDHLPGAGRIGRTIVSHRPYRTVKDLVSRRVLRTSDFAKIQAHISVD